MRVEFRLDITPRGQGRARAFAFNGHARVHKAKDDEVHEAKIAALAEAYRGGRVFDDAVKVWIVAVMPRPAGMSKRSKRTGEPLCDPARVRCTAKPDADNIAKAVLDGLSAWWRDDALVCWLAVEKWIAALDEAPHYEITIAEAE